MENETQNKRALANDGRREAHNDRWNYRNPVSPARAAVKQTWLPACVLHPLSEPGPKAHAGLHIPLTESA